MQNEKLLKSQHIKRNKPSLLFDISTILTWSITVPEVIMSVCRNKAHGNSVPWLLVCLDVQSENCYTSWWTNFSLWFQTKIIECFKIPEDLVQTVLEHFVSKSSARVISDPLLLCAFPSSQWTQCDCCRPRFRLTFGLPYLYLLLLLPLSFKIIFLILVYICDFWILVVCFSQLWLLLLIPIHKVCLKDWG